MAGVRGAMGRSRRWIVRSGIGLMLCAACAGRGDPAYTKDPNPPPHPIQPVVEPAPELPAHRFDPPTHIERAYLGPAQLEVSTLPALVVRNDRCVAAKPVREGSGPRRVRSKRAAAVAPRSVTGGAVVSRNDTSTRTSKVADATSAPARPSPAPAATPESFSDDEDLAGADVEADASEAPAADAPSVAVGGATRRARRRANRSRDRLEKTRKRQDVAQAPAPSTAMAEPEPPAPPPLVEPPREEGWGQPIYLSNDDTMSLASAQRIDHAVRNMLPLHPDDVRPHELLNAAFSDVSLGGIRAGYDFSVQAFIEPNAEQGEHGLAVVVRGRPLTPETRRNAALTLLVDVSGSMKRDGRMELLRRGMLRMVRELQRGDIINLVTFDHRVCTRVEGFVVGRDDVQKLTKSIHALRPRGSTNLFAGLQQAYTLADRIYQPKYTNRVLVMTDARANRGVTDPRSMALVADRFDARRVRLSGIGVGDDFDDELLDTLTEAGRGAYVFMGNDDVVQEVFGTRFISLIETVANDVHFRLHLPPTLRVERFHGEQASVHKADVQAIHFYANTTQVLLSDVQAWQGELRGQDEIMLEIEYLDPETGDGRTEFHPIAIEDTFDREGIVRQAQAVVSFGNMLRDLASLGEPPGWKPEPRGWQQPAGAASCASGETRLRQLLGTEGDVAAMDILGTWRGYCQRFGPARPPRKR